MIAVSRLSVIAGSLAATSIVAAAIVPAFAQTTTTTTTTTAAPPAHHWHHSSHGSHSAGDALTVQLNRQELIRVSGGSAEEDTSTITNVTAYAYGHQVSPSGINPAEE